MNEIEKYSKKKTQDDRREGQGSRFAKYLLKSIVEYRRQITRFLFT